MISSADFIPLGYTPDLTQAGIVYACRSISHTYDRMGGSVYIRMRRIVAGKAVELAFRRYLVSQAIPHDFFGRTPFTDPDNYDVTIGGRRCDIKGFQLFDKATIRKVRRNPDEILQASALVPFDQANNNHVADEDLYIFAFVTALVASRREETERAAAGGQPFFLMHALPPSWTRPTVWASLGKLALKSEGSAQIELGGQREDRVFQVEQVSLSPGKRQEISADFYSLSYLRIDQQPMGRIGVHCPRLNKTVLIQPNGWGNIWVYGMDIILAGYLTRGEFRRRASILPSGSRVFQYRQTQTKNFSLPVSELRPLPDLFERAKAWNDVQNR